MTLSAFAKKGGAHGGTPLHLKRHRLGRQLNTISEHHQPTPLTPDKDIGKCDCAFLCFSLGRSSFSELQSRQNSSLAIHIHLKVLAAESNDLYRKRRDGLQELCLVGFRAKVSSIDEIIREHWFQSSGVLVFDRGHDVAFNLQYRLCGFSRRIICI